jgi:hypothetical protein
MLVALLGFLRSLFRARRDLALENLALRQQLVSRTLETCVSGPAA